MKRLIFLLFCAILLCVPTFAAEDTARFSDGSLPAADGYLVTLPRNSRRPLSGSQSKNTAPLKYAENIYLAGSLEAAERLSAGIEGALIEPNYLLYLHDAPMLRRQAGVQTAEDPNAAHFATMRAAYAADNGCFGQDCDLSTNMGEDGSASDRIVVAVIDSGLCTYHADIDASHVVPGRNFFNFSSNTDDTDGHGTFVAGEILASLNDICIDGLAPQAYIMPLKVFEGEHTSTAIVISAINYAVEQRTTFERTHGTSGCNVCVINMSLGGEGNSQLLKSAVDSAISAGIIVICSAGNDGNTAASYPAQYAIGVGSTDPDGGLDDYAGTYSQVLSSFNGSGYKNKVWVTAPGTDYVSLDNYGELYTRIGSGTSFSAPLVSALAALSVSCANDLTTVVERNAVVDDGSGRQLAVTNNHLAFKLLLRDTSDLEHYGSRFTVGYRSPLTSDGQDIRYGFGVIDFQAMLSLIHTAKSTPRSVTVQAVNRQGSTLTAAHNALRVQIFDADGTELHSDAHGVFSLPSYAAYRYRISASHYAAAEGSFTVTHDQTLTVTLSALPYDVRFTFRSQADDPLSSVRLTVTDDALTEYPTAASGGTVSCALENGSYHYTAEADGYLPATGTLTIDDTAQTYADGQIAVSVTLQSLSAVYRCTVAADTEDGSAAAVALYDAQGAPVMPQAAGFYALPEGEYTFTVSCPGYPAQTHSFTVTGEMLGTEETRHVALVHTYPVDFTVAPEGLPLMLTVYNAAQEEQTPTSALHYELKNDSYRFTLSCDGYQTISGSFRVDHAGRTVVLTLSPLSRITLSQAQATLKTKGSVQLKAGVDGRVVSSHLTWASSDSGVAKVSSKGKVTGVGAGSCTITVTDETGGSAACEITVVQPITKLSLTPTKLSLVAGERAEVSITVKDTSGLAACDYVLDYDARYVAAELTGESTLAVTALDRVVKSTSVKLTDRISGKSAKLTVAVGKEADTVTTTMKSTAVTLLAGKSQTLKATAAILGSGDKPLNKNVSWSVSDPTVASVSSKGKVTALSVGTCTVTAVPVQGAGELTFTVTVLPVLKSVTLHRGGVKVSKLSALVGDQIDVAALLDDSSVLWSKGAPVTGEEYTVTLSTTAKASVAVLDADTGVLTCVGKGSATVRVTVVCGKQKKTASLTVSIKAAPPLTAQSVYRIGADTLASPLEPD